MQIMFLKHAQLDVTRQECIVNFQGFDKQTIRRFCR
ncbi:MAG: hypothetical protein OJF52_001188 [Nitrospira sp.]|nr:MAG: hypothetical protein OJF52_001188 [Nitrospira sp.]